MAKILLDYAFPISVITPLPAASTAMLKQVCVVAKPKSGQEANVGELFECATMAAVAVRTDNENSEQLFNAGMAKVHILLADDLDLADAMTAHLNKFFTVLISDDFEDADLAIANTAAEGDVTITNFANLVDAGDDEITIGSTVFVAQAGAATPGDATFQAATSNNATASSLATQINAHATAGALVTAVADGAEVNLTAKTLGVAGNVIALAYADEGTATVGATVSGGTLEGGTDEDMVLDVGAFTGVVGVQSQVRAICNLFASIQNRSAFFSNVTNKAKNMFFAFGKLLSNLDNWTNQQYIPMPFNDGVDTLGDANSLFDSRVSFVLNDDQFANRLALFAVGGEAIAAPYILKNLMLDLQSRSVTWISANQPAYTVVQATLLQTRLQEDVLKVYISVRQWITDGTLSITLVQDNFVASGSINVAKPKALWRVFNQMQQTL